MDVDVAAAASGGRTLQHDGRTYYFCALACRTKFEADPRRYVREHGM
jgi:YHS domain-containing protein